MEVHFNILDRKLNLLSSWLQFKFPNDPTFPRLLIQESEPEVDIKIEAVANSEIPGPSNGNRWIQLVDPQSILDTMEPEVGNNEPTESCITPPALRLRSQSRKQKLPHHHTYRTRQYETPPSVVNVKRRRSDVPENLSTSRNTAEYESSGDNDPGSHALDADNEQQGSDNSERDDTPNREVPDPYLCIVCNMNFPNPNKLLLHKYKVHRAPRGTVRKNVKAAIHRCPECNKPFSLTSCLRTHVEKYHPKVTVPNEEGKLVTVVRSTKTFVDPSLPCRFCGKLYRTPKFMRSHLRQKHSGEATPEEMAPLSLTCMQQGCSKRLKTINAFNRHLQGSHPEVYQAKVDSGEIRPIVERKVVHVSKWKEKVTCPECHKLLRRSSVAAHIRDKHQDRPLSFLCPHCGVRKKSKHTLESHMETHFQERKYKCVLCPFAARQQSGLRGHMITAHTPNREKEQCPHCGDLFTRVDCLRRHISRIHENKRPFPCHRCDKAFMDKTHLRYHLKTHENPIG